MSRIGRLPVEIPAGVEVTVAENNVVTVKGPKGTLTESLPVEMDIKVENNQVVVTRPNDLKKMKSLHGTNTVYFQCFLVTSCYTDYHVVDQSSC